MISLRIDKSFTNPFQGDDIERLQTRVKAIIYARVSTHGQARDGYSLESQVEMCAALAKEQLHVAEDELIAVIEAGDKGDDPNRPALNFALWLVDKGIGRTFICLHPDRFARALHLQLVVADRVWSAGYDLHFVETDEVDPNNPESMLLFNLQGAIAQYNKAKILANSRRGRRQKVKNGKIPGLRRIYGYTFDKEADTLREHPDEKAVYLMMVDWLLNGKDGVDMSLSAIARELSLLSIPAPNGDVWYQATVSRILKNPVYMGTFYYGKTEYKQHKGRIEIVKRPMCEWLAVSVPAFIDEATYAAMQAKMSRLRHANRGSRPQIPSLLKGKVRCGRCGGAVVTGAPSRSKTTGEVIHRYYVCSGKSRKVYEVGTGREMHRCRGRNWRQDVIDQCVWRYLVHVIHGADDVLQEILAERGDPDELEARSKERALVEASLREKHEERRRWIQLRVRGRISDMELDAALPPLEQDIKRLSRRLHDLEDTLARLQDMRQQARDVASSVANVKRYIAQELTDDERRMLVNRLLERVVLHDDAIEIITAWDCPRTIVFQPS
ncbi:Resolvase domain-containing protein [Alicyclobacillus hesperidum URH17-3-68]|uniref:Recombinase zinc beta ribbon domain-containing protein n=1 Tax=Alicyclobacillus hesperidum TaxID=89784 RepID=A0A1H2SNR4_9BACL|nr:recombinase family protein [Alicyclobacillus hesperidum]EJY55154.1 Resolvase domain-containing protein [Alicyclobacillus hesperidum URH17-3-68]GLV12467.1 resolvase-like protein [Alicyclobacillus hesperidum]GLV12475.1 resolvase-like protein [Alicyclobacillus hesperidum]SDW33240.1 Recombinase zinc beta ribbon domain-containing protein [Alicyclobacillus hesperidum]